MRKISSIICIVIFISCFFISKSYALDKKGCSTFDVLCKLTGKGAVDPTKKKTKSKKSSGSGYVLNEAGCHPFDILCRVTGKGAMNETGSKKKIKKVAYKHEPATELGLYTGMFDFSDDKQKAGILGFEHQDENLFRESFLGSLSPITGGFITENSAIYLYSGVQAQYELGFLKITPSFAPGYYNQGDGKDLGHPLEFKTEVQMTIDLSESSHLGMSYNHISNASLGTKNPGANSYMFNFLKEF
tara:strand:+ start:358 stop:1089 length:732 start_codon:yes stop_codon:yes gene_type:complete